MRSVLLNTIPDAVSSYTLKCYQDNRFVLPLHKHEKYEITWVVKGSGTRVIGDHISFYQDNDIVLIGPGLPHQWQSDDHLEEEVKAYTLFFDQNFPSADFWDSPVNRYISEVRGLMKRGIRVFGSLRDIVKLNMQKIGHENESRGMISILNILQEILESSEYEVLASEGFRGYDLKDTSRMGKVTAYIFDHITESISVNQLADIACLHPNSLLREFKHTTGFSVIHYINKLRIGMAVRLLMESDQSIIDICFACGFNNLSNFNRQFKKITGKRPKEYRVTNR